MISEISKILIYDVLDIRKLSSKEVKEFTVIFSRDVRGHQSH